MKEPQTKEEKRIFRRTLEASYRQEIEELNEWAPNVEDVYYDDHRGTWVVTYKNGLEDDEFDTKEELYSYLNLEADAD